MPAASTPLARASSPLGISHPLFTLYRPHWVKALDVYEGTGGFLDDARPYLEPHPREWLDHTTVVRDENNNVLSTSPNPNPSVPSPKLKERRTLARYENIAATLIDQLQGALFRGQVSRLFTKTPGQEAGAKAPKKRPLEEFWEDADGLGTKWPDLLKEAWKPAAVFGHVFLLLEWAEDRDVPVVRLYTPLDAPDWLVDDRGALVAIKFLEAAPRTDFATAATHSVKDVRVRIVTATDWKVTDTTGKVIQGPDGPMEGPHPFGVLPVVPLYTKRRALLPVIGKSLLGDPQLYLDLYNLVSETRELLRKQTFSILNIPLGERSVEQEQQLIGQQTGTGNILFSSEPAQMLSADAANVTAYHEHIDRLIRTIYRLAVLPWDTDSKEAESAESRRIKREDLNQQLAGFADELQRAEVKVSQLVYRAVYGDAAWERWWEQDGLSIRWPETFDVTPLAELMDGFERAMALELGETATKEAKKLAARAVLPNVTEQTRKDIDAEIDAAEYVTEEERRQDDLEAKMAKQVGAFGGN